jgi:hypothetical protein
LETSLLNPSAYNIVVYWPFVMAHCVRRHTTISFAASDFITVGTKGLVSGMEISTRVCEQPACLLVRELIGKLAIIAACCDLLGANAQATSESTRRLDLIRDAAKEMAERLQQYQCGVLEAARSVKGQGRYIA